MYMSTIRETYNIIFSHKEEWDNIHTIEDLQNFDTKYGLDLKEKRYMIGVDEKTPKCYGIIKDSTGNVTVYKNKADGTRVIRYKAYNEPYAIDIIKDKFQKELNEQLEKVKNTQQTYQYNNSKSQKQPIKTKIQIYSILPIIIISIMVILFVVLLFAIGNSTSYTSSNRGHKPQGNYYETNDGLYYYIDDDWYYYDDYTDSWVESYWDYDTYGDYYDYYSDYTYDDYSWYDSDWYDDYSYYDNYNYYDDTYSYWDDDYSSSWDDDYSSSWDDDYSSSWDDDYSSSWDDDYSSSWDSDWDSDWSSDWDSDW